MVEEEEKMEAQSGELGHMGEESAGTIAEAGIEIRMCQHLEGTMGAPLDLRNGVKAERKECSKRK